MTGDPVKIARQFLNTSANADIFTQRYILVAGQKQKSEWLAKMKKITVPSADNSLFQYINWIDEQNDFFIDGIRDNKVCFNFVKQDFSLFVELEFTVYDGTPKIPRLTFQSPLLCICWMIARTDGTGTGVSFVKRLIRFSNEAHVPIMLYCEKSLISYYKKLGFKHKGNGNDKTKRMLYMP